MRPQLLLVGALLLATLAEAAPPSDHQPEAPSVCDAMTPPRGDAKPQPHPSPYSITVDKSTVSGGEVVRVHVSGSKWFKGVYLQARRENGEPVGEFPLPEGEGEDFGITLLDCPPGHHNALSYSASPLPVLDVDWKAPTTNETIVFRATIEQNYYVFWTGIESDKVTVKSVTSTDKAVGA